MWCETATTSCKTSTFRGQLSHESKTISWDSFSYKELMANAVLQWLQSALQCCRGMYVCRSHQDKTFHFLFSLVCVSVFSPHRRVCRTRSTLIPHSFYWVRFYSSPDLWCPEEKNTTISVTPTTYKHLSLKYLLNLKNFTFYLFIYPGKPVTALINSLLLWAQLLLRTKKTK